jgi:hypothetical protein
MAHLRRVNGKYALQLQADADEFLFWPDNHVNLGLLGKSGDFGA